MTCGIESLFKKGQIFNKCKILGKIIVWFSFRFAKVPIKISESWSPLATGYRGYFRSFFVAMRNGYWPHKKLWVPMCSWYQREKKFMYRWLPCTGEIKKCEYRLVPGTDPIWIYADPWCQLRRFTCPFRQLDGLITFTDHQQASSNLYYHQTK